MNITQNKIDSLNLPLRIEYLKIELLDENFKTLETIEGKVIEGSLEKNANNATRRSGTLKVAIPIDNSQTTFLDAIGNFTIESGGKIWIDKNVKIYYGMNNYNLDEIIWYSFGICMIDAPIRDYSADNYTISFSVIDLMAKLTGARQGQLPGMTYLIEQGYYETVGSDTTYIRTRTEDALRSVITELTPFSKVSIYPIPSKYEFLPYDIKVEVGSTVYDLIVKFLDILSTWQIYFDNDGILTIEPIPSGVNDATYPFNTEQIIASELSVDFTNVKNQIIVYGRLNTLTFYTEDTTYDYGISYNKLILNFDTLTWSSCAINSTLFGFLSEDVYNIQNIERLEIQVGGTTTYSDFYLVKFEGTTINTDRVAYNEIEPNTIYALRIIDAPLNTDGTIDFASSSETTPVVFELYSKQQASACIVNDNLESPFYINTNLAEPNFYCGRALSSNLAGVDYLLTLNDESLERANIFSAYNHKLSLNGLSSATTISLNEIECVSIAAMWTYAYGYLKYLEPLTEYTIKCYVDKNGNDMNAGLRHSDTSGELSIIDGTTNGYVELTFTTDENGRYYLEFYCNYGTATAGTINFSDIQLNLGDTANDYVDTENNLLDETLLTFMANATNASGTTIAVKSSCGAILKKDIPIVQNIWTTVEPITRPSIVNGKIGDDYTIWKIQYDETNNWFVLLGRNEKAITYVLSGGIYDNIYADTLATERCKYELYLHSSLNNNIKLGVIPNYLLDVNYKIEYDDQEIYSNRNDNYDYENFIVQNETTNENNEYFNVIDGTSDTRIFTVRNQRTNLKSYLIKNITFPFGTSGTPQDIEAIEIYNDKNYVGDDYEL